jgi:hypothetical protein
VEGPSDVFNVSLLQCELQGKDRGRLVASHEAPMPGNVNALFMNLVSPQKGIRTRE